MCIYVHMYVQKMKGRDARSMKNMVFQNYENAIFRKFAETKIESKNFSKKTCLFT